MDQIKELVEKNGKGSGTLVGVDGHAFSLIAYTERKLYKAGWTKGDISTVRKVAMSGNYNALICTLDACLEEEE
tara:strand:- start:944 stop:1165 length:222 start_codon:yes stop_codon:yes gene_type:complete